MGLGDYLLAAGQAKLLDKKVRIGDGKKETDHPLRPYIPYLDKRGQWFVDCNGRRGYIDRITPERIYFNGDYRAEPCEIDIEPIENDYIIFEPNTKHSAPIGKWYPYFRRRKEFHQIKGDVVHAARMMAGSRGYVGVEGFLHHLAAAFNKPAVVVMGAFNHPDIVGYDFHHNIYVDDPELLGDRRARMPHINPDEVEAAIDDALEERDRSGQ